ncbi:DciA family protein [Craterilacuibacter sp.]|uniref:DciA family protein n=1 Tax=Craterilacuibacter sp. TaxID=2870909 RepID=UPI003F2DEC4D
MSSQRFQDFARQNNALSRLTAEAGALLALDAAFQKLLPAELAGQCRAVRIRDEELVLFADNGMVGARLRMLGNSLLPALARQGYIAQRSRVRIAPQYHTVVQPKTLHIGAQGIAAIEQAAQTLDHPDLARALARLALHQKQRTQD